MTEVLLIDKRDATAGKAAFAARCHVGALHLADVITTAIDPLGVAHNVQLYCTEIRLNENVMADELGTNYGGLIILEGPEAAMLDVDWVLRR